MKKLWKVTVILIIIVVALVSASAVLLRVFLPPDKAKTLIIKQLTGRLKREVQVGPVSVGIFSGLTLSDLKVSESPDFSHGTFLSSDRFSVRLALWPLLFHKVVVHEIVLKHPEVTVVRYADGKTFNFSDLLTPSTLNAGLPTPVRAKTSATFIALPEVVAAEAAPQQTKTAEPPFSLVISEAVIQHGVIHFVDRSPARQSADIDPLDLKLKNVSLTSPFRIQASLTARAKGVEAMLHLVGDANLATGSFKIKDCTLSSAGSVVTLQGKASQLKSQRPSADLQLDIKQFKLSTLAPFAALPPSVRLNGPITGNAKVKGDQTKMAFSARLDLTKDQVLYAKEFAKPEMVPLTLTLTGVLLNLDSVDLQEVRLVLGSLHMAAHGRVEAVKSVQPEMNIHLETNSFPIAEVAHYGAVSLPKELKLGGKAQLAADVSGTSVSSHLAAKFEGKDLSIAMGDRFAKPAGTALNVAFDKGEWVKPQTLNVPDLTATLDQLKVQSAISYQVDSKNPRFTLNLKTNSFPLQDVTKLVPMTEVYRLSGMASLEARASGSPQAPVANGTLTLRGAGAHYQQSDLTNLVATLNFTQQDVATTQPLTGKLNGSDFTLKLTGHRLTTQPDVAVDASFTALDLDKLLAAPKPTTAPSARLIPSSFVELAYATAPPPALPPMKISGHLAVGQIKQQYYKAQNLDAKWNLTQVTPDLSRVSGTATLKQGAGKLENVEKLVEMSKSARLALLPLVTLQKLDSGGVLKGLGIPSLQSIPFDGIRGDYLFQSGVMNIKTFDLTGHDLSLSTQGTIGLAGAQLLDVHVAMKLAPGAMAGIGQLVADSSGRPTLNFTAQGTAANPHVHLDVHEATHRAVQQVGQQLLRDILGQGQNQNASPPGGTSQPAPSNAPNPADQLQKALKNIFH
jgi:hypothetical protein